MSATALTALQLLGIIIAYLVITVWGPHLVMGKAVRFRNRYERFLIYTMVGNFYVINLVYILELLHISYRFTLILFTVIPCAVIKIHLENIPFVKNVKHGFETLRRLFGGQLKLKAYHYSNQGKRTKIKRTIFENAHEVYFKNIFDVLLIVAVIACSFWTYGVNLFVNYGYKLTDVVVHNYWINQLSENEIFTKGVYPYGYHNVIYYIHEVFDIDTYVILRLYSFVIVTWITLIMLCFLKLLCKSKYLPYLACFGYTIVNIYEEHTYSRFAALIPQEYSMLFVLPAIYCGFEFFREQRREIRGSAANRSFFYLCGFAISFAMALSVHFYGFIITGIYCVAMAIGFCRLLFSKPYFRKVVVTVIISLVIAVAPMVTAYLTGTELEYSLKWGLSVITGTTVERVDVESESGTTTEVVDEDNSEEETESESYFETIRHKYVDRYGFVFGTVAATLMTIESYLDYASINYSNQFFVFFVFFSFLLLIIIGTAICLSRERDAIYGMVLSSTGVFMFFMTILVSAGGLGIVQLMDLNRASIFFSYLVGCAIVLFLDSLYYLLWDLGEKYLFENKKISVYICNAVSLVIVLGIMMFVFNHHYIRDRISDTGFESNDAIICLSKIISETEDETWTVISANDEGRMVYGHGFHFELIDFLRGMEYIGASGWIRIPTQTTFLFIEKKPIDYYISWEGSGTSISERYAEMNLPLGNNRALYEGENRWICMSRFYYWAQCFKGLYPNEVSVFYETDSFICYRIEQNPYRLFNFAIDYGYNIK